MPGQGFSKLQKNSPAVSSTGVIFIMPEGINLIMPEGGSPTYPKGSNTRAFSTLAGQFPFSEHLVGLDE